MRNKAIEVEVPVRLWSDLSFALMRSNETRKLDEVVAIAIKHYLSSHAWRDIWIRRNVTEGWTRAAMWREQHSMQTPGEDRRRITRRIDD